MSRQPKPPVFLQRASYRQRRIRGAAKLLPFAGLILWALPLGWTVEQGLNDPVGSGGVIFIFAVWVILIVLSAIFSNLIRAEENEKTEPAGESG